MTDDEALEIIKCAGVNATTFAEYNATLRANGLTAVAVDGKEKRVRATMVCLRMTKEGRTKDERIAEMEKPEWWRHATATAKRVAGFAAGREFITEARRRLDIEDAKDSHANGSPKRMGVPCEWESPPG